VKCEYKKWGEFGGGRGRDEEKKKKSFPLEALNCFCWGAHLCLAI
jgi:hypothetical protein